MSVYSAVFENNEPQVNVRPTRTTRGIPPARYPQSESSRPSSVFRASSMSQIDNSRPVANSRSNLSSISSRSHHSSVFDVMTGKSNTVQISTQPSNQVYVPASSYHTNHSAPVNVTYVTYAQMHRPLTMSTLPVSQNSTNQFLPMRTNSVETVPMSTTFVNYSMPMSSVPIIPVTQMSRCSPCEIPWSQATVSTTQVPVGTFACSQSMPQRSGYQVPMNTHSHSQSMPMRSDVVHQLPRQVFADDISRTISTNQAAIIMNGVPRGTNSVSQMTTQEIQWNQVPRSTNPVVTVNENPVMNNVAQGSQQQYNSTVYQSVFSGNSGIPNLTRSSSIGSINSYTRNWVEEQDQFTEQHTNNEYRNINQNPIPDDPQNYLMRDQVLSDAFKALTARNTKDLPKFTGEIKEWPLSYSEYIRTTQEFNISQSENLRRLGKALDKKARETVLPLLSDEKSVDIIIKVLQKNFGQPQWVISTLIEELKSFPNLKDDNIHPEILMHYRSLVAD